MKIIFSKLLMAVTFQFCFSEISLAKEAPKRTIEQYLSQLAPMVVGRPLSAEELKQINSEKHASVEPIVSNWVNSARFLTSVRLFTETRFSLSGNNNSIDFDIPGNIAVYLEKNKLPYSQLVTLNMCVDANLKLIACDSQAPFAAGILTTQAFLSKFAGAFNISRAAQMMRRLTCSEYPMSQGLEPSAARESLIDLFATSKGEQNFGFGTNCYLCHGQFAKHAQLFTKFNLFGKYVPDANGIQDPDAKSEGGHSTKGTFTSHYKATPIASSESSEIFGKPVQNLAEAGAVIAQSPTYSQCAIRKSLGYFLRLKDTTTATISVNLLQQILGQVQKKFPDPTFGQLLHGALTDPTVVESYLTYSKKAD